MAITVLNYVDVFTDVLVIVTFYKDGKLDKARQLLSVVAIATLMQCFVAIVQNGFRCPSELA